jgi:colanic acid/amylovoran biosynthesis glycosyltransferase
MRLLFVLDQWPELSETFIVNEVEALRRMGHEVRVHCGQTAAHPNPEAPRDLAVSRWPDQNRVQQICALAWLVARRPRACVVDLWRRRRWRQEEWVRPLRSLAPEALRIVRRREQHLHAHFAAGAALDALRLAALTGLPFTVTAHAYDIFMTPRNLGTKLRAAGAVFTGCDYNVAYLRKLAPESRVHRVIMGVDADAFRRSKPLPGGRTIIAIGRLVEKKGFHVLVDAAAALPGVRVQIIGDGPMRSDLARRAAASGASVELLGARSPAQVCAALEDADVLAMPCIIARDGDRDSMPVVVKEAMAMELLVVASDEVGLPECVHEPWGRLAPPGDAASLAEALDAALACSIDARRRAGALGRRWVCDHARVDAETARMSAVIEALQHGRR